jgi:hypothetical protein
VAVLRSQVSPASDAFRANDERMRALVEDIAAKAETVQQGGSDEARQRHVSRGKLLPRQRLNCSMPARPFSKSASSLPGICMGATSPRPG